MPPEENGAMHNDRIIANDKPMRAVAQDRTCPQCRVGVGIPRAVQTIVGRRDVVKLTIHCLDCDHEWIVEQTTVGSPPLFAPGGATDIAHDEISPRVTSRTSLSRWMRRGGFSVRPATSQIAHRSVSTVKFLHRRVERLHLGVMPLHVLLVSSQRRRIP